MNKVKDAKSTAVTFLVVGILGLILVVLFSLGILPIQLDFTQKIIYTIVLGIVFGFFLIVGIVYALNLNKIKTQEIEKQNSIDEIVESFISNHKNEFDVSDKTSDENDEELFFVRNDKITSTLTQEYPELNEEQVSEYAELIYDKLFT